VNSAKLAHYDQQHHYAMVVVDVGGGLPPHRLACGDWSRIRPLIQHGSPEWSKSQSPRSQEITNATARMTTTAPTVIASAFRVHPSKRLDIDSGLFQYFDTAPVK
jgi:hypothetical protein